MINRILVKRYADALFAYVKDTIGIERAIEDLNNIKNNVINGNPEFLIFLKRPEITYTEKISLIQMVLNEEFSEEIKNFLKLLLEKGRIEELVDIIEYMRMAYSGGAQIEALLKTSFPLDLEVIKKLEGSLQKRFNKKIKFFIELDGSLLGGIQVRVGNTIIDGSVRRRLDELREKLMAVRV